MSIFEENGNNDDKFEDMFAGEPSDDQNGESDEAPEESSEESQAGPNMAAEHSSQPPPAPHEAAAPAPDEEEAEEPIPELDGALENITIGGPQVAASRPAQELPDDEPLENITIGGPPTDDPEPAQELSDDEPLENITIGGPLTDDDQISYAASEDHDSASKPSEDVQASDEPIVGDEPVAAPSVEASPADEPSAPDDGDADAPPAEAADASSADEPMPKEEPVVGDEPLAEEPPAVVAASTEEFPESPAGEDSSTEEPPAAAEDVPAEDPFETETGEPEISFAAETEEPEISFAAETEKPDEPAGQDVSSPLPNEGEAQDPFADLKGASSEADPFSAEVPDPFSTEPSGPENPGALDPFDLLDDEEPQFEPSAGGVDHGSPYSVASSTGEFNPFSSMGDLPSTDGLDDQPGAPRYEFGDLPDPGDYSAPPGEFYVPSGEGQNSANDELGPYDSFDQSRLSEDRSADAVPDEPVSLDTDHSELSQQPIDLSADTFPHDQVTDQDETSFGELPLPGYANTDTESSDEEFLSDGPWTPDLMDSPLPVGQGADEDEPMAPTPSSKPKWSPQPLASQQEYKVSTDKPKSTGALDDIAVMQALPPAAMVNSQRTIGPKILLFGSLIVGLAVVFGFGGFDVSSLVPGGVGDTLEELRTIPAVSNLLGPGNKNAHVFVPTKEVINTSELDPSEQDIDDLLGLGDAAESSSDLGEDGEENAGIWVPRRRALGTQANYDRYRYLPNPLTVPKDIIRYWTAAEEEEYLEAVTDERAWRRYQVVEQIRTLRLAGTELIFWEAIYDETDWVRLAAVFGLVDLGIPVSYKVVARAFDNANPKLVANFLKRFIDSPSPGGKFILRMAVKIGAPRVRARALRLLAKYDYQFGQLYVSAATADDDEVVRAFAEEWLGKFEQDRRDELLADMAGFRQNPLSEPYVDFPKGYAQGYGKATSLVPIFNLKVLVPLH